MRRRGFTIIELFIALAISMILLTSFGGLLMSIWIMAKESTDELQCIVRSESLRQKVFYRMTDENGDIVGYGGLLGARSISFNEGKIEAEFSDKDPWSVDLEKEKKKVEFYGLDASKRNESDYLTKEESEKLSLQYLYRAIPIGGKTTYYDRLVIPFFLESSTSSAEVKLDEFIKVFGGTK